VVSVTMRLVDFMDARSIPAARLEVSLTVVPLFPVLPDEAPGPPVRPRPDHRLAEVLTESATTDAEGRAQVSFDALDVFSRLTGLEREEPPGTSVGAVGTLRAASEFLGIRFGPTILAGNLEPDAQLDHVLPADLGTSIVGHTTPETVKLWFHLPFEPAADHQFTCHVRTVPENLPRPLPGELDPVTSGRTFPVTFEPRATTAVVPVAGLAPGGTHDYALVVRRGQGPTARRFTLVTGRFRTPTPRRQSLSFAFGSCHEPVVTGTPDQPSAEALRSLVHWQRLADRNDLDMLLLVGDQIYGDDIEDKWPPPVDDFTRYLRRYQQLWAYRPMRQVLRSTPTYMILDDHDVADDFGIGDLDDLKVAGALEAYNRFQHSHGPSQVEGPPFHYSFRWGPAAFFVMDGRTQRGEGSPVFGSQQLQDLRRWAASPQTRAADLIFFVAPVPLALLPTELIRDIVDELTEQVFVTAGVLAGLGAGLLGFVGLPPPFSLFPGVGGAISNAAVLGAVGFAAAEVLEGVIDRNLLLEADLGERWDLRENQPDLILLLDLLFDLANGVGDDPPRKRAVFILSGDIHAATMHGIRSLPKGNGERHVANPVITQLTSSALSREPVSSTLWIEAVSRAHPELDLDLKDINVLRLLEQNLDWERLSRGVIDVEDVFGEGKGEYFLDPNHDRRYLTQYAGLLMQRTVGFVNVERRDVQRRVYRFDLTIKGESGRPLQTRFDLDLDADLITPQRDNAEFVRQSVPDKIEPGRRVPVQITMRNTGAGDWKPPAYGLEVLRSVWGIDRVPVPEVVRSGQEVSFQFEIRAPSAGQFTLHCRMSRAPKLGSQFGRFTRAAQVTAIGPGTDCAELRAERDELRDARAAKLNEIHGHPEPPEELLDQLKAIDANIRAVERLLDELGC
jgi:PhoD-like phosphatase